MVYKQDECKSHTYQQKAMEKKESNLRRNYSSKSWWSPMLTGMIGSSKCIGTRFSE